MNFHALPAKVPRRLNADMESRIELNLASNTIGIVGGEQGSLNPAPVPVADIEEVWYYYVGNNQYALLYLKDDKVVRIHLGAT